MARPKLDIYSSPFAVLALNYKWDGDHDDQLAIIPVHTSAAEILSFEG